MQPGCPGARCFSSTYRGLYGASGWESPTPDASKPFPVDALLRLVVKERGRICKPTCTYKSMLVSDMQVHLCIFLGTKKSPLIGGPKFV